MRKLTAFVLISCLFLLAACTIASEDAETSAEREAGGKTSASPVTPSPTPAPTPEPPLRIAFSAPDERSGLFVQGIAAEANEQGALIEAFIPGMEGLYDAVIVYAHDGFDLEAFVKGVSEGVPIVAYYPAEASPTSAPDSRVARMIYDGSAETSMLFDMAMTYPPHDTPVRLLGMFEEEQSEGRMMFDALYEEGKVLPKGAYVSGDKKTPEEWLFAMLERYPEGTLDGIVIENEELAFAALAVMREHNRVDIEMFCGELNEATAAAMHESPKLFVASVGENPAVAGRLAVMVALPMAKGAAALKWVVPPCAAASEALTDELLLTGALTPAQIRGATS